MPLHQAQLPVVLTLDAEGHITIDNKPMSIDDAEAMVKQRIQENPNASVILQTDKRAAHGQVVAIMDMLKQSGVKRLAIAAEQKRITMGLGISWKKAAIISAIVHLIALFVAVIFFVVVPAIQDMETYESTSHKVYSMMAAAVMLVEVEGTGLTYSQTVVSR